MTPFYLAAPKMRLLFWILAGCWLLASPSAYGFTLIICHTHDTKQHVNTVARARVYAKGGVGFADRRTKASKAFECLMRLPRLELMGHLDTLIESDNPAAQAYGFAGLRQRAPWLLNQRRNAFKGGDKTFIWQSGCIGHEMTLNEYLSHIGVRVQPD